MEQDEELAFIFALKLWSKEITRVTEGTTVTKKESIPLCSGEDVIGLRKISIKN